MWQSLSKDKVSDDEIEKAAEKSEDDVKKEKPKTRVF